MKGMDEEQLLHRNFQMIDYKVFIEEMQLFGIDIAAEIIDRYLATYETQIIDIEACIKESDFDQLAIKAHKFANSVANFYADKVLKTAGRLEQAARSSDGEAVLGIYPGLKQKAIQLAFELVETRKDLPHDSQHS